MTSSLASFLPATDFIFFNIRPTMPGLAGWGRPLMVTQDLSTNKRIAEGEDEEERPRHGPNGLRQSGGGGFRVG